MFINKKLGLNCIFACRIAKRASGKWLLTRNSSLKHVCIDEKSGLTSECLGRYEASTKDLTNNSTLRKNQDGGNQWEAEVYEKM